MWDTFDTCDAHENVSSATSLPQESAKDVGFPINCYRNDQFSLKGSGRSYIILWE